MTRYHLAQLNVGIATAPLDSDMMADFMNNLDRINALAESSPGFRVAAPGRQQQCDGVAPDRRRTLVNMSVWTDAQSLSAFVFRTAHVEFMRGAANGSSAWPRPISCCGGCPRATFPRPTRP